MRKAQHLRCNRMIRMTIEFSGQKDNPSFISALNGVSPIWRQALVLIFFNVLAVSVDPDFSSDQPFTVLMVIVWVSIFFFVPFLNFYYYRTWKRKIELKDEYSLLINDIQDIQLLDITKIVVERKNKFLTVYYNKEYRKTHIGFLISKHSILELLKEMLKRESSLADKLFCRDAFKLFKNESDNSQVTISEIENM